jgi:hypothetical protein
MTIVFKALNKAILEDKYNELYDRAEALLKEYDPCRFKNGVCANGLKNGCCIVTCKYKSEHGCTTRCLPCKLHLCGVIGCMSTEFENGLRDIRYEYSLYGFDRGGKGLSLFMQSFDEWCLDAKYVNLVNYDIFVGNNNAAVDNFIAYNLSSPGNFYQDMALARFIFDRHLSQLLKLDHEARHFYIRKGLNYNGLKLEYYKFEHKTLPKVIYVPTHEICMSDILRR